VIHGGGFYQGTPDWSPDSIVCAQDLAAAGYIAFSIEYRLAPPGFLPGQVSDGRFPDQTDDVKLAVTTARNDARCNGQVGAVGGSGGGSHVAFVAGTGTVGDDRIDVGVALSGAHDYSDFSAPSSSYFMSSVTNYVGVASTDTAPLRAASPAWVADSQTTPLLLVNSLNESMPYSQLSDMVQHLDAVGVTNYQVTALNGGNHSFGNWPTVKEQALAFIAAGFAGGPGPTSTPAPSAGDKKLINVSTRASVGTGDNVMVGGFIVTGDTEKRVVLRGLGPSLSSLGVTGFLPDPYLEVYNSAGTLIESNDNRVQIPGIANPLMPSNSSESFLLAFLPPGSYTTVLHGANYGTGIALVEAYDMDPQDSRLANISTRSVAGSGSDEMIGGFIIGGDQSTNVIVRALGPSLAVAGITNFLPDPMLELHDGNGALVATNDNWKSNQMQEIIATGIPPTNDSEAAIVATLPPGNYTAVTRDVHFQSGVGLVEAYDLEP
jgi:acetyl esterase/lipase